MIHASLNDSCSNGSGQGDKTVYARDDAHKDELLKTTFAGRGKIDIGRFKGLGEIMPIQLRETTMEPTRRALLRVVVARADDDSLAIIKKTKALVESLMGRTPELRFHFIQENARFVRDVDV